MTAITPLAAFAPLSRNPGDSLPRWRPGLDAAPLHGEVFASAAEGSGAALALAMALDGKRQEEGRNWLWVQDARAIKLGGRPYQPGLPATLRHRLIHVAVKSPEDALFALEEGLRCRDLAFVIGEIAGNPKALNFTAARRLSLAVERHGVPLWLVRLDAEHGLSSARQRWQVRAAPSRPSRWNPAAPGVPAWQAELFRARAHPPGSWLVEGGQGALALRSPDSGSALNPHGESRVHG